jgi:DNA-directed RNA polymerase specialized sigma24 family protein
MTQAMVIAEKAEERKVLFMRLYQQAFPLVAKFVRERGGSFEEAKDVFQDALVIYYEKLATSNIVLQYSEASYIFGITKHLWGKKHKQHLQQLVKELRAVRADAVGGQGVRQAYLSSGRSPSCFVSRDM